MQQRGRVVRASHARRFFSVITVYLAFAAAAVPRAASAQDPGLQQRVNALEARVQALSEQVTALTRSRLVEVNCAAGERIQPAVAQVVGFTFETGNVSGNASGNIDCPVSPGPKAQ